MDELCVEKHKAVDQRLDKLDKISDKHADEIDEIKEDIKNIVSDSSTLKSELKNVCKQIGDLISTLKWVTGIIITVAGIMIGVFSR